MLYQNHSQPALRKTSREQSRGLRPTAPPRVPFCPSKVEWWCVTCPVTSVMTNSRTGPGAGWALQPGVYTWCVHVCHVGPQPAASLAPASLSRAVKKRQHQGSQVYAREISCFSKSTWLLLESLDPDRFLKHVSLKRDNLQRTPALALSPFRGHKEGYGHDATKEGRELYTNMWEQSPGRWAELRFRMVHPKRCFGDRQELLPSLPCPA